MTDFASLGLLANLALFTVAAAAVWFAGSRLAACAGQTSKATGAGQAVAGIVLLAGAALLDTSRPAP